MSLITLLQSCQNTQSQLGWKDMLTDNHANIYGMILYKHLTHDKIVLIPDFEQLKQSGSKISIWMETTRLPSDLSPTTYCQIYRELFSLREAVYFRDITGVDLSTQDRSGLRHQFTRARDIRNQWDVCTRHIARSGWNDFRVLHQWYIMDFLDQIHPFENKNFLCMSVMLDMTLIQWGYLPISIKTILQRGDIAFLQGTNGYENFLNSIEQIYKGYHF